MILCLGTFGKVLSCCKQEISEAKLIARIAWVVDEMNSCLGANLDYEISAKELDTIKIGNASVVSKLLSCSQNFELSKGKRPSVEKARERFNSEVMPFINEDMAAKAVLAVRKIISLDDTIIDTQKETFKKCLGMYRDELLQQTRVDVPGFFARILLYTTYINNRNEKSYVGMITDKFIEEAAGTTWEELKWDTATQILELIPAGEKRLSDRVNQLTQLRPSIIEDEEAFVNMDWIGINMTGLDPSIWGRTEIRDSDAQKLLSRKINPFVSSKLSDPLTSPFIPKPHRVFKAQSGKKQEEK